MEVGQGAFVSVVYAVALVWREVEANESELEDSLSLPVFVAYDATFPLGALGHKKQDYNY